jgi:hypothetical protein
VSAPGFRRSDILERQADMQKETEARLKAIGDSLKPEAPPCNCVPPNGGE